MRLFWAIATILLALVPPAGPEAQCVMYGDYVNFLGGCDTPGDAGDVTTVGDLVYQCCEGDSSPETFLMVVDVSDPRVPQALGYYDFSMGSPKTVSVKEPLRPRQLLRISAQRGGRRPKLPAFRVHRCGRCR